MVTGGYLVVGKLAVLKYKALLLRLKGWETFLYSAVCLEGCKKLPEVKNLSKRSQKVVNGYTSIYKYTKEYWNISVKNSRVLYPPC